MCHDCCSGQRSNRNCSPERWSRAGARRSDRADDILIGQAANRRGLTVEQNVVLAICIGVTKRGEFHLAPRRDAPGRAIASTSFVAGAGYFRSRIEAEVAVFPEGRYENSPGWSVAQAWDSVVIMFLRPVGPHRRPSSALNLVHAIALLRQASRPRHCVSKTYIKWGASGEAHLFWAGQVTASGRDAAQGRTGDRPCRHSTQFLFPAFRVTAHRLEPARCYGA
jgi:hypothetical protein